MILAINQLHIADRVAMTQLQIAEPQLVGVIGPNGSGKSTLLAALAGLLPLASGAVRFNQYDVSQLGAEQRRQLISYLPQTAAVTTAVTVAQVLQQGLVNLRLPRSAHEVLAAVADEFHLSALWSRPITELSGGEQRRVQVARACLGAAEMGLFDEPGSGLDIGHQLELMDYLKARSQRGQLVIVALHDLGLAAQYCDRLVLLHEGQVAAFGSPAEVLTDARLAAIFGIAATWLCNDDGVALLAKRLPVN